VIFHHYHLFLISVSNSFFWIYNVFGKVQKILTLLKLDVGGILVIAALNKSSARLICVLTPIVIEL
jgi:hypothetical protein